MAIFIVRVELHRSSSETDYATLHSAMAKEGFLRTIKGDDGVNYILPTAEYCKVSSLTKEQILESAKRATNTTNKSYSVLVGECAAAAWYNLTKA